MNLLAAFVLSITNWLWPLPDPQVVTDFEIGANRWDRGHRGIDIAGRAGQDVHAVAAGTVIFAGVVAGVPVVSIDHGAERSTYQPVIANVDVGQNVTAGSPIGTLQAGHRGCDRHACLHLGRRAGRDYRDPAELLASGVGPRLVSPYGKVRQQVASASGGDLDMTLLPAGTVTSRFGMRRHPITGIVKLHDGSDIAAACGTPIRALSTGVVTYADWRGAYGMQVEIDHGGGLRTSYSHLSQIAVRTGSAVSAGALIGRMGTTGMSTGCHLHLMKTVDGQPTDPLGGR